MPRHWKALAWGLAATLLLSVGSMTAVAATGGDQPADEEQACGPAWRLHALKVTFERVADLLGMEPDALKEALETQSLTQVAQSKGVGEEKVIDTILEPLGEIGEVLVKYGYVTQERLDNFLSRARARVKEIIEREPDERGQIMEKLQGRRGMLRGIGWELRGL